MPGERKERWLYLRAALSSTNNYLWFDELEAEALPKASIANQKK